MLEKNWNSPCSHKTSPRAFCWLCTFLHWIYFSKLRKVLPLWPESSINPLPSFVLWTYHTTPHSPVPLLRPTHWRGRGSARSVHLHHLITNRSGWPQPTLSHIFHDFSSPLLLLMSAQCGWLRMLKMTHTSNVSHLVQRTIIFKVEKVHFHWRLVCGWLGTWQCVYAWAYVCLHVCSP